MGLAKRIADCGASVDGETLSGLKRILTTNLSQKDSPRQNLWAIQQQQQTPSKKQTRKFSYTRLLTPHKDIASCAVCGTMHQAGTICGNCYEKVRAVTAEIKRKMMAYNPYKGEIPNKEIEVKFADDDKSVRNGRRVVELERERPSWFLRDLKKLKLK